MELLAFSPVHVVMGISILLGGTGFQFQLPQVGGGPPPPSNAIAQAGQTTNLIALAGQTTHVILKAGY